MSEWLSNGLHEPTVRTILDLARAFATAHSSRVGNSTSGLSERDVRAAIAGINLVVELIKRARDAESAKLQDMMAWARAALAEEARDDEPSRH